MSERHYFLVAYIGSAALVAFLATCLTTPHVATFACDMPQGEGARSCQLVNTWTTPSPGTPAAADADTSTSTDDAIEQAIALGTPN